MTSHPSTRTNLRPKRPSPLPLAFLPASRPPGGLTRVLCVLALVAAASVVWPVLSELFDQPVGSAAISVIWPPFWGAW